MDIVKVLDDYPKTNEQKSMVQYLKETLPTSICYERIKNKEFLKRYMTPLNNFVIHTTAFPCCEPLRVLR